MSFCQSKCIYSRRPWCCIFHNWSRVESQNVYLSDTRIYLTWNISSFHNECKLQNCRTFPPRFGAQPPSLTLTAFRVIFFALFEMFELVQTHEKSAVIISYRHRVKSNVLSRISVHWVTMIEVFQIVNTCPVHTSLWIRSVLNSSRTTESYWRSIPLALWGVAGNVFCQNIQKMPISLTMLFQKGIIILIVIFILILSGSSLFNPLSRSDRRQGQWRT